MSREVLVGSVLTYALWPLLNVIVIVLWAAAALDILSHKRQGSFTNTVLWSMAASVSVAAVVTLTGIYTVCAGQWSEAMSGASTEGVEASKPADRGSSHAYVFSFGLENASYGPTHHSTAKNEDGERKSR